MIDTTFLLYIVKSALMLTTMFCLLKPKKQKETEYYLTQQQFIALLDDQKRAFVLRECEEAMKNLEKDKEILTSKSFILIGYIFATLSGALYISLPSVQSFDINHKWIFQLLSPSLLILTIRASVLLVIPREYESIWGDAEDSFQSFKISTVDIRTIETFKIETMTASYRYNSLLHTDRVKKFEKIFWTFIFLLSSSAILTYLCYFFESFCG